MRLLTHSISLAIGLLACHRVIAWPDPEPFKGTIPHNDREITMDPALMRRGSDDKLFLFTTGKHKGEGYMWTAPSIRGPWTKSAESAFTDEPWNAPYVSTKNQLISYLSCSIIEPHTRYHEKIKY